MMNIFRQSLIIIVTRAVISSCVTSQEALKKALEAAKTKEIKDAISNHIKK